jgi:hypothetical protein
MYEWNKGQIRLGITSTELNASYQPARGLADVIRGNFSLFVPVLFSAQYNTEFWSLTSEYALRNVTISGYYPQSTANSTWGESYYFQGSYRFAEGWEGYARYDLFYPDRSDRNGKKFAAATGGLAYDAFAKDVTVGLRWDVTSWFMLRAEYHRINGAAWTAASENQGETQQHWDLWGLSASFRF